MPFKQYLAELQRTLKSGQATEPSYYPALKSLLEALDPEVQVLPNPKHISEVGNPDFRVQRKGQAIEFPVGHVEAKDIGEDLNKIEKSEQLKRYLGLPNLILTDFVEFRWYTDGQKRLAARLGPVRGPKLTMDAKGEAAVGELLGGFLRHSVPPVQTPKELALRMARLAHLIRGVILGAFEREPETGTLHKQFEAFQTTLIPDLKSDVFADMYAQTIAYGLFAAACQSRTATEIFTREKAAHLIPKTNPFLRKLFNEIAGPDLDDRIRPFVDDLVAVLRDSDLGSILADFGKRTGREDPVVHFYEDFLQAYDRKVREMRGVYYTPEAVVLYIVRSIDHLLKTRFNKPDGLADKDVLILDPACGTGTFLYYVIRHIHDTVVNKKGQKGAWSSYVSQNLLKRVFGFELLMAPYAVAHLKLGLLLQELGYTFDTDERLGIYLTNTLEEAFKAPEKFFPFAEALAEEGTAASGIKRDKPIMVVLGNPPYSNFGQMNKGKWIMHLLNDYKKDLQEKKINIDDDFIKFIRFGQWRIDTTGEGILGFITNNTYIDGITHRRMRRSLLDSFNQIYTLNLHGDSRKKEMAPDGGKDENVFDIMQGVAIGVFVKEQDASGCRNNYAELWGLREGKYGTLLQSDTSRTPWVDPQPTSPYWFFVPRDTSLESEYEQGSKISEFMQGISGIETKRDHFAIDFGLERLRERIHDFVDGPYTTAELKERFSVQDNEWAVEEAVQELRDERSWEQNFVPCLYRPFDKRWIVYSKVILARDRGPLMKGMTNNNVGLVVPRQSKEPFAVLATECVCTHKIVTVYDRSFVFPLFLYPTAQADTQGSLPGHPEWVANFSEGFIQKLTDRLKLTWTPGERGDLRQSVGPRDVFDYIYALFHSPTFRTRYTELLRVDFPRLPLTSDKMLFTALTAKGTELVSLHLMESPKLAQPITRYDQPEQPGQHAVEKVWYDEKKKRVYINKTQYFEGVPKEVWEFHIGGYQVCEKWLKDRQKAERKLSSDDIDHYQKIVVALNETIRIMREIDEVIPGWPLP